MSYLSRFGSLGLRCLPPGYDTEPSAVFHRVSYHSKGSAHPCKETPTGQNGHVFGKKNMMKLAAAGILKEITNQIIY